MSQECVTVQTFVEIEEQFSLFFFPPLVSGKWRRTRRGNGIRRYPVWRQYGEYYVFVLSLFHCLNVWGVYINKKWGWGGGDRGGGRGGLVLTVRHLTGGGVGGGGFLRGDLRFRHSRGGLDLKGGVE